MAHERVSALSGDFRGTANDTYDANGNLTTNTGPAIGRVAVLTSLTKDK